MSTQDPRILETGEVSNKVLDNNVQDVSGTGDTVEQVNIPEVSDISRQGNNQKQTQEQQATPNNEQQDVQIQQQTGQTQQTQQTQTTGLGQSTAYDEFNPFFQNFGIGFNFKNDNRLSNLNGEENSVDVINEINNFSNSFIQKEDNDDYGQGLNLDNIQSPASILKPGKYDFFGKEVEVKETEDMGYVESTKEGLKQFGKNILDMGKNVLDTGKDLLNDVNGLIDSVKNVYNQYEEGKELEEKQNSLKTFQESIPGFKQYTESVNTLQEISSSINNDADLKIKQNELKEYQQASMNLERIIKAYNEGEIDENILKNNLPIVLKLGMGYTEKQIQQVINDPNKMALLLNDPETIKNSLIDLTNSFKRRASETYKEYNNMLNEKISKLGFDNIKSVEDMYDLEKEVQMYNSKHKDKLIELEKMQKELEKESKEYSEKYESEFVKKNRKDVENEVRGVFGIVDNKGNQINITKVIENSDPSRKNEYEIERTMRDVQTLINGAVNDVLKHKEVLEYIKEHGTEKEYEEAKNAYYGWYGTNILAKKEIVDYVLHHKKGETLDEYFKRIGKYKNGIEGFIKKYNPDHIFGRSTEESSLADLYNIYNSIKGDIELSKGNTIKGSYFKLTKTFDFVSSAFENTFGTVGGLIGKGFKEITDFQRDKQTDNIYDLAVNDLGHLISGTSLEDNSNTVFRYTLRLSDEIGSIINPSAYLLPLKVAKYIPGISILMMSASKANNTKVVNTLSNMLNKGGKITNNLSFMKIDDAIENGVIRLGQKISRMGEGTKFEKLTRLAGAGTTYTGIVGKEILGGAVINSMASAQGYETEDSDYVLDMLFGSLLGIWHGVKTLRPTVKNIDFSKEWVKENKTLIRDVSNITGMSIHEVEGVMDFFDNYAKANKQTVGDVFREAGYRKIAGDILANNMKKDGRLRKINEQIRNIDKEIALISRKEVKSEVDNKKIKELLDKKVEFQVEKDGIINSIFKKSISDIQNTFKQYNKLADYEIIEALGNTANIRKPVASKIKDVFRRLFGGKNIVDSNGNIHLNTNDNVIKVTQSSLSEGFSKYGLTTENIRNMKKDDVIQTIRKMLKERYDVDLDYINIKNLLPRVVKNRFTDDDLEKLLNKITEHIVDIKKLKDDIKGSDTLRSIVSRKGTDELYFLDKVFENIKGDVKKALDNLLKIYTKSSTEGKQKLIDIMLPGYEVKDFKTGKDFIREIDNVYTITKSDDGKYVENILELYLSIVNSIDKTKTGAHKFVLLTDILNSLYKETFLEDMFKLKSKSNKITKEKIKKLVKAMNDTEGYGSLRMGFLYNFINKYSEYVNLSEEYLNKADLEKIKYPLGITKFNVFKHTISKYLGLYSDLFINKIGISGDEYKKIKSELENITKVFEENFDVIQNLSSEYQLMYMRGYLMAYQVGVNSILIHKLLSSGLPVDKIFEVLGIKGNDEYKEYIKLIDSLENKNISEELFKSLAKGKKDNIYRKKIISLDEIFKYGYDKKLNKVLGELTKKFNNFIEVLKDSNTSKEVKEQAVLDLAYLYMGGVVTKTKKYKKGEGIINIGYVYADLMRFLLNKDPSSLKTVLHEFTHFFDKGAIYEDLYKAKYKNVYPNGLFKSNDIVDYIDIIDDVESYISKKGFNIKIPDEYKYKIANILLSYYSDAGNLKLISEVIAYMGEYYFKQDGFFDEVDNIYNNIINARISSFLDNVDNKVLKDIYTKYLSFIPKDEANILVNKYIKGDIKLNEITISKDTAENFHKLFIGIGDRLYKDIKGTDSINVKVVDKDSDAMINSNNFDDFLKTFNQIGYHIIKEGDGYKIVSIPKKGKNYINVSEYKQYKLSDIDKESVENGDYMMILLNHFGLSYNFYTTKFESLDLTNIRNLLFFLDRSLGGENILHYISKSDNKVFGIPVSISKESLEKSKNNIKYINEVKKEFINNIEIALKTIYGKYIDRLKLLGIQVNTKQILDDIKEIKFDTKNRDINIKTLKDLGIIGNTINSLYSNRLKFLLKYIDKKDHYLAKKILEKEYAGFNIVNKIPVIKGNKTYIENVKKKIEDYDKLLKEYSDISGELKYIKDNDFYINTGRTILLTSLKNNKILDELLSTNINGFNKYIDKYIELVYGPVIEKLSNIGISVKKDFYKLKGKVGVDSRLKILIQLGLIGKDEKFMNSRIFENIINNIQKDKKAKAKELIIKYFNNNLILKDDIKAELKESKTLIEGVREYDIVGNVLTPEARSLLLAYKFNNEGLSIGEKTFKRLFELIDDKGGFEKVIDSFINLYINRDISIFPSDNILTNIVLGVMSGLKKEGGETYVNNMIEKGKSIVNKTQSFGLKETDEYKIDVDYTNEGLKQLQGTEYVGNLTNEQYFVIGFLDDLYNKYNNIKSELVENLENTSSYLYNKYNIIGPLDYLFVQYAIIKNTSLDKRQITELIHSITDINLETKISLDTIKDNIKDNYKYIIKSDNIKKVFENITYISNVKIESLEDILELINKFYQGITDTEMKKVIRDYMNKNKNRMMFISDNLIHKYNILNKYIFNGKLSDISKEVSIYFDSVKTYNKELDEKSYNNMYYAYNKLTTAIVSNVGKVIDNNLKDIEYDFIEQLKISGYGNKILLEKNVVIPIVQNNGSIYLAKLRGFDIYKEGFKGFVIDTLSKIKDMDINRIKEIVKSIDNAKNIDAIVSIVDTIKNIIADSNIYSELDNIQDEIKMLEADIRGHGRITLGEYIGEQTSLINSDNNIEEIFKKYYSYNTKYPYGKSNIVSVKDKNIFVSNLSGISSTYIGVLKDNLYKLRNGEYLYSIGGNKYLLQAYGEVYNKFKGILLGNTLKKSYDEISQVFTIQGLGTLISRLLKYNINKNPDVIKYGTNIYKDLFKTFGDTNKDKKYKLGIALKYVIEKGVTNPYEAINLIKKEFKVDDNFFNEDAGTFFKFRDIINDVLNNYADMTTEQKLFIPNINSFVEGKLGVDLHNKIIEYRRLITDYINLQLVRDINKDIKEYIKNGQVNIELGKKLGFNTDYLENLDKYLFSKNEDEFKDILSDINKYKEDFTIDDLLQRYNNILSIYKRLLGEKDIKELSKKIGDIKTDNIGSKISANVELTRADVELNTIEKNLGIDISKIDGINKDTNTCPL